MWRGTRLSFCIDPKEPYLEQTEGRLLAACALPSIHPSAWKSNSPKFAVASHSSTRLQPLDNRLCCTPLGSKHPDLVAVVAPMGIKVLRLVTMQLPEKFSPIGVGTNRSSHIRPSGKFAPVVF